MNARIEYTVEDRRGNPTRRAKEVSSDCVERTIDKLCDKGAYNFDVKYERTPTTSWRVWYLYADGTKGSRDIEADTEEMAVVTLLQLMNNEVELDYVEEAF